MPERSFLAGALRWADRGWLVHPLKPGGKRPLLKDWPNRASREETQIRAWWDQYPEANVGIVTGKDSGLIVLDVDPRNGGLESLPRLGAIPETFRVETGGGGYHYYFEHEQGLPSTELAPGVELKSDGHQIVAPPSVHPSGERYTCTDPEAPLADPPTWLRQGTAEGTETGGEQFSTRASTLLREGVEEGARNEAASYLARHFARTGIAPDVATAMLETWNAARNRPPIDESAPDEKRLADVVRSNYRTVARRAETEERPALSIRPLSEVELAPEVPSGPVPKLSATGRVVMLAGREKSGKSTLVGAGVSAMSSGARFLGNRAERGLTLYVKPPAEGHPSDFRRIVENFGGDLTQILVMDRIMWPDDPLAELKEAVRQCEPDLLVVDTLSSTCASLDLDPGRSSDWAPILNGLTEMAQDYELAVVLVHHARKSDGSYRDSTQIGANVDMILEMYRVKEDFTRRRVEARGRWPLDTFHVRLITEAGAKRFELVDPRDLGGESLDQRILDYVQGHPGCSTQEVRDNVTGRGKAITEALSSLETLGLLENRGTPGVAHAWHCMEEQRLSGEGGEDPFGPATPGQGGDP